MMPMPPRPVAGTPRAVPRRVHLEGNSAGGMRAVKAAGAFLVIGFLVSAVLPAAQAGSVREQDVFFGFPRRPLVSGVLDFEAGCRVTASYPEVAVRDGASAPAYLTVSPGVCDAALYIFGVRVALPLTSHKPLGRVSFHIPGVSGLTFGLADVSVDLTSRLRGTFSGDGSVLSASPGAVEWTAWGTAPLAVTAHSGSRGSTLFTTAPYTLSLAFGVGVSVYLLGVRVYSWDATVAGFEGTPAVGIPVAIDLAPTPSELTEASPESPYALRIAWTACGDDDVAAYEVSVSDGGEARLLVVRDPSQTSASMDAAPSTTYDVRVTVIDTSGQRASSVNRTVRTPDPSAPSEAGLAGSAIPLLAVAAITGGLGAERTLRRARRRRAGTGADAAVPGSVLAAGWPDWAEPGSTLPSPEEPPVGGKGRREGTPCCGRPAHRVYLQVEVRSGSLHAPGGPAPS